MWGGDREAMGQKVWDTWWKWGEVELLSGPTCEQLVATTTATVKWLAKRVWGGTEKCLIIATNKEEWRKNDLEEVRQTETTMINCYTSVRMASTTPTPPQNLTIQKSDNIKFQWEREATGTLIRYWQNCRMVQPLWKNSLTIIKLNLRLTIWLSNPTAYVSEWNENLCLYKNLQQMFINSLIVIAKNWKQP